MRALTVGLVGTGVFWMFFQWSLLPAGQEGFVRVALMSIFLMLGLISWQLTTLRRRR